MERILICGPICFCFYRVGQVSHGIFLTGEYNTYYTSTVQNFLDKVSFQNWDHFLTKFDQAHHLPQNFAEFASILRLIWIYVISVWLTTYYIFIHLEWIPM